MTKLFYRKCYCCRFRDHFVGCCDYLLMTGHQRNCEGGRKCTKFEPDEETKKALGITEKEKPPDED